MNFEFLKPVSEAFKSRFKNSSASLVFHRVHFYNSDDDIDLNQYDIAIMSLDEDRNSVKSTCNSVDFDEVRSNFYKLNAGSWGEKILDLGHVSKGDTVDDTYFLIKSLTADLLKSKTIPLIFGGSQDVVFPIYRAFDGIQYMINIASIDAKFDLGSAQEVFSNHSFVGKLIVDEPYNLFNYANLGYLTFYNAQEEIDLMDKLYFEAIRYGEMTNNISVIEPILRDSDLVSIDLSSVSSAQLADPSHNMPNGLNGIEICTSARYAGISDRSRCFHIGEIQSISQSENLYQLIAQLMWYFIEGYHLRQNETISVKNQNIISYKVPIDFQNDEYLVFLHSRLSNKWWIKAPESYSNNNSVNYSLISCNEKDYIDTCNKIIPRRWYKAKLKGYF